MPNGVAGDLYRYLEHLGDPFYIDVMHRVQPYDPRASDLSKQTVDLTAENGTAYLGATWIVVEEEGGVGINSTLEQRVGRGKVLEWSPRNIRLGE